MDCPDQPEKDLPNESQFCFRECVDKDGDGKIDEDKECVDVMSYYKCDE
jgi:hypothetical protein